MNNTLIMVNPGDIGIMKQHHVDVQWIIHKLSTVPNIKEEKKSIK